MGGGEAVKRAQLAGRVVYKLSIDSRKSIPYRSRVGSFGNIAGELSRAQAFGRKQLVAGSHYWATSSWSFGGRK